MKQKEVIAVQFKSKHGAGYSGQEYSYYTDVPLKCGQLIEVTTKYGISKVKVVKTGVDIETIPKMIRCYMKTITEENLLLDAEGNPIMDTQIALDDFFMA